MKSFENFAIQTSAAIQQELGILIPGTIHHRKENAATSRIWFGLYLKVGSEIDFEFSLKEYFGRDPSNLQEIEIKRLFELILTNNETVEFVVKKVLEYIGYIQG